MRQMIYAMQFRGSAAPVEGQDGVLKAATTAPSCVITSSVGSSGVSATIARAPGGDASFTSTVTMTGETAFKEDGRIDFGDGHAITFSTLGQGHLGPSADPKLSCGAVMWKVESGGGQFAGASGYITSNFSVSDTGEVVDHHFGVIFVQ
jgi:hypothetical protein